MAEVIHQLIERSSIDVVLIRPMEDAVIISRSVFHAASRRTVLVGNEGADKLKYESGFEPLRRQFNAFSASCSPNL